MKILSADDLAENRYFIEALLHGYGHEVVSAANGEEALVAARKTSFDLIISDLLMPKMDGFQLIRELRRDERFKLVPIVVYTATYTDAKDEELARDLGADAFLIKPLDPASLMAALEAAVLDRKNGKIPVPKLGPEADAEKNILKQYNSRLIAKLEKKMGDLEKANRALLEDIAARIRVENERKLLEEQLCRSQKMQAIGTLSSGIAHDFNNILAGILCAADMGKMDPDSRTEVLECFDVIRSASIRGRDLVRHILTFSRNQPVQRQPINLPEAVQESLRFLRTTISGNVKLQADFPATLPKVSADLTQIHQIIINLCTNACHAIGENQPGNIVINLREVEFAIGQTPGHLRLRPGHYVHLTVKDDGCGMNEATRQRIFEPFFTTKPADKGTGLGLSVVHSIMLSYEGAITVDSEPGQGSTFNLFFPVWINPKQATEAGLVQLGQGNDGRPDSPSGA